MDIAHLWQDETIPLSLSPGCLCCKPGAVPMHPHRLAARAANRELDRTAAAPMQVSPNPYCKSASDPPVLACSSTFTVTARPAGKPLPAAPSSASFRARRRDGNAACMDTWRSGRGGTAALPSSNLMCLGGDASPVRGKTQRERMTTCQ